MLQQQWKGGKWRVCGHNLQPCARMLWDGIATVPVRLHASDGANFITINESGRFRAWQDAPKPVADMRVWRGANMYKIYVADWRTCLWEVQDNGTLNRIAEGG